MNIIKKITMVTAMVAFGTTCMGGLYIVANVDLTTPFVSCVLDIQDTSTPTTIFYTNRNKLRVVVDGDIEYSTIINSNVVHQFTTPGLHKMKVYCGTSDNQRNPAIYFNPLSMVKKVIQFPSEYGSVWVANCSNLTTMVQKQQDRGFTANGYANCVSLQNLSLPNATNIVNSALQSCSSLDNPYLPNVVKVGDAAFKRCSSLKTISLPLATMLGQSAFAYCDSLETVDMPMLTELPPMAFQYSGIKVFSSPNFQTIPIQCFQGCTNLVSVSLPNATLIDGYAFQFCSNLVEVTLPAATSILSMSFNACPSIRSFNAPNLEFIGGYAMAGIAERIHLDFPNVKDIDQQAFSNSTGLESISLPSATNIATYAFRNCNALTNVNVSSYTMSEVQERWGKSGTIQWRLKKNCTVICKDGTLVKPDDN